MSYAWITGASGFLGVNLTNALALKGHRLVLIDPRPYPHCVPAGAIVLQDRVENVTLENLPRPEQIYHLACTSADPRAYQMCPVETLVMSMSTTEQLCRYAARTGARILLASSSEVYGDPTVLPTPESYGGNVINSGPRGCYDNGKRVMETLAADFTRAHGLDARVVRIFNTYGPWNTDTRVTSSFVRALFTGEPMTILGNGEHGRSFCYVDDLITAMVWVMACDTLDGTIPVNLGSDQNHATITQAAALVQRVGKELGLSCPAPVYLDGEVDDPRDRLPDLSLLRASCPGLDGSGETFATGLQKTVVWWMTEHTVYFYGHRAGKPYASFSNFYPASFAYQGDKYHCSEQALMAAKARVMGDSATLKAILAATTPGECKRLGRTVSPWDQSRWDERKYDLMRDILLAKFRDNPTQANELLATGDRILAEASATDCIWGIGLSVANAHRRCAWRGQNLLGKALMRVRRDLQDHPTNV